jgi:hypothetical protein
MEAAEFASIGQALWGTEWRPHAARLLDVALRTVRRWEAAEQRVPQGAALQIRTAAASVAVARSLPLVLSKIDEADDSGRDVEIALSEKPGDAAQALMNDMLIAAVKRAGRIAKFKRVATAAETPEDRAIEAALGRPGSRA